MRHDSKCVDLSCHGLQTTRSIEINGESASKIMRKKRRYKCAQTKIFSNKAS